LTVLQSFILGLIQGVSEFLPISSSGHLVLVEHYLNVQASLQQLKAFDVILHAGSLLALLLYFYRDWILVLKSFFGVFKRDKESESDNQRAGVHLLGGLILATIPAAIAGVLLNDIISDYFRVPMIISGMMVCLAIIFFSVEFVKRTKTKISLWDAFLIGCAQIIGLFPGISRSGITISMGMMRGIKRVEAARFSFMMAAPIIMGANILIIFKLFKGGTETLPLIIYVIGFLTSFVTSICAIKFLLNFLKKFSLRVFSVYLLVIFAVMLTVFLNGQLSFIKHFVIEWFIPFFKQWGYLLVIISSFVESIPLLGVIIPGGTIVHLSGVLAIESDLGLFYLILMSSVGAIFGDLVGFYIGRRYGEEFLVKYGPRIGFKEEYLYVTHRFCHQYGGFAVIIGRFNNLVRPFIPMVIGSSKMPITKFLFFNIIGGILWSVFAVLIGYFARQSWEIIQGYVGIGGGILFSAMLIAAILFIRYEVRKLKEKRRKNKDMKLNF